MGDGDDASADGVSGLDEHMELTEEQSEAADRQPNRYLRSLRQRRGWTLEDVVKELDRVAEGSGHGPLGVDTNTLSRWERGVRRPSRRYARLLCLTYELPPTADQLARICQRVPDGREEAHLEPELPHYLALADLAAGLDWERLSAMLRTPPRLDEHQMDELYVLTRKYAQGSETAVPAVHLRAVRGHLELLKGLLASAHVNGQIRGLRSIAGETAALAGWLSFLLDDRGSAHAAYALAGEFAGQAEDTLLGAHLLVVRSLLHSRVPWGWVSGGDTVMAMALLDRAQAEAGPPSPFLHSWLLAHRAGEHAAAGDANAAQRDLEGAATALSAASTGSYGLFGYWDGTRLAAARGACAVSLGESTEAITVLEDALAKVCPGVTVVRCNILTDLGAAYALEWELGQACVLLTDALAMAAQAGLGGAVQRIVAVRQQHLTKWRRTSQVAELDEQLRMLALNGFPANAFPDR
jgi:transcriptional regulator with XRE-family HTH domain